MSAKQFNWTQVQHIDCEKREAFGEIVIVVKHDKSDMAFCCKSCHQVWTRSQINSFPQDWKMKDASSIVRPNPRIVIPGRENGGR